LKNVKVPSGSLMNVSRLISLPDLKVAPGVKSHDYHVLLAQMIAPLEFEISYQSMFRMLLWTFAFFFNAIDVYDVTGQDKNMYYGQIQEICEVDFHDFKIPLFYCNWVDVIKGVVKDKYGFISVDIYHQRYKSEPFVLAKHLA
jgi:hypothetical protein